MPLNPRQQIKQSLQSVINELTKAGDKLSAVGSQYEEHHPDYFEAFCVLFATIEKVRDGVKELSDNI